jgi:hypothetical protein
MHTVSFVDVNRFENIFFKKSVYQCVRDSSNTASDVPDAQICKVPSSSAISSGARSLSKE